MLDAVAEWFSELDGKTIGIALLLWSVCLLVIWKLMYDPKFLGIGMKIVLSIAMLPLCYIILYLMSSDR